MVTQKSESNSGVLRGSMEKADDQRPLVKKKREEYRAQGLRVGFTSGVFDLLHRGHVEYLKAAKTECDKLIVAVNSDRSVRALKGELRPIQSEGDRCAIIESLEAVDHAFIFDEENNGINIRELTPDVYLKAGDYTRSQLTSAPLVESYGGEVKSVSFVEGRSSSSIIERVIQSQIPRLASSEVRPVPEAAPAAFLDRDGTLCKHVQYLSDPEQFELLPGVIPGLLKLQSEGFRLVIITNQPGIGFGYFTKEDFYRVNLEMLRQLSAAGILIDKIYFSPYTKAEQSPCRKPGTLLGERAISELNIIRESSIMFGDSEADIQFAKNLGCMSCLITEKTDSRGLTPDIQAKTIEEGVMLFLQK